MTAGESYAQSWWEVVASQCIHHLAVPMPHHLPLHVHALVGEDGRIVDVAAAMSEGAAAQQLAEAAMASRLGSQLRASDSIGAGLTRLEATLRGVLAAVGRRAAAWDCVSTRRIRDWEYCIRKAGGAPLLQRFADMDVDVELVALELDTALSSVEVTFRFARPPHVVRGTAIDLRIEVAIVSAWEAALRKLAIFELLRPHLDDIPRRTHRWVQEATGAVPTARRTTDGDCYRCDAAQYQPATADDLVEMRRKLAVAGYGATVRLLYPNGGDHDPVGLQPYLTQARVVSDRPTSEDDSVAGSVDNVAELEIPVPVHATFPRNSTWVTLSRRYHEHTKTRRLRTLDWDLPQSMMQPLPPHLSTVLEYAHHDYRHATWRYSLPKLHSMSGRAFEECVQGRRSMAAMHARALTLEELSYILGQSAGVTGSAIFAPGGTPLPLRAAPSPGALYAVDLFVLAHRILDVQPGVYYYHPPRHELQLVRSQYCLEEIAANIGWPDRFRASAATIFYVGALWRNQWKYREQGYRMVLVETGHMAQNVALSAEAIGLVAHPMSGYVDDYFNNLIGLDGVNDAILYLTLLGAATSAVYTAPRHE